MITGYNHNIIHNERVFHIQTEDSGTKYPHIITHLFVGGNILSSKKKGYEHLLEQGLDEEGLEKAVRAMMQEQHKDMLRELKAGKHDGHPLLADSNHKRIAPGPLPGASSVIAPELGSSDPSEAVDSPVSRIVMPSDPAPAPAASSRAPLFQKNVLEPKDEPKPERAAPTLEPRSTPGLRGSARMSRRRPSRERPSFQIPMSSNQPVPPSKPTAVMSALRNIEIGSGDNLDSVLFDDDTPTVQELPSASPEFAGASFLEAQQADHGPLHNPTRANPGNISPGGVQLRDAGFAGGPATAPSSTPASVDVTTPAVPTESQAHGSNASYEPKFESSDKTEVMTPGLDMWLRAQEAQTSAGRDEPPVKPRVQVSVTPPSKDS